MKARERKLHWRIRNIAFAAACLPLAAFPAVSRSAGAPDEVVALKLDPAQTTVSITLDATLHTVHGIFKLKAGELDFDPKSGKARGSIVVDATSGNTDNSSRDKKMHDEVLESRKFPEIVFLPEQVSGAIPANGTSQMKVDGVMRIHGQEHPVTLVVDVDAPSQSELHVKSHASLPYQKWGMKNPSNFFLHVGDTVEIEIVAAGQLTSAAGTN